MFRMVRNNGRIAYENINDLKLLNREFSPDVDCIVFNPDGAGEHTCRICDLENIEDDQSEFKWIKVNGVHKPDLVQRIAKMLDLHPLVVEDILDSGHRPKLDIINNHYFLVLRLLDYDEEDKEVEAEQVSLIVGPNYIVTFQEKEHNLWDELKDRALKGVGRIKTFGYHHLLFALLDAVVDEYFLTVSRLAEDIEELEQAILNQEKGDLIGQAYHLKQEVLFLNKSLWPLREVLGRLSREYMASHKKQTETNLFMANLQQDMLQVIEAVESLREMISDLIGLYMGRKDLRLNQIGQALTVVATVFIPMTFITGYYGMNFTNMPMIEWKYGYIVIVLIMIALSAGMVGFFYYKDWFRFRD